MTTLGARLTQEHQGLDALYEEIANRVHCGDTVALDASWSSLEAGLLAHLDFEEEVTRATVITHSGAIVSEPVQKLLAPAGGTA